MMKYFWLVIDTLDGQGKRYAYAQRVSEKANLAYYFSRTPEMVTANLCPTKTRACQIAKIWNHQHKINGVYAFEEPQF